MSRLEKYMTIKSDGSNKRAYVGGDIRISVITPLLIRIERDTEGVFEDGVTQSVICRDFGEVDFAVRETSKLLIVQTAEARFSVSKKNGRPVAVRLRSGKTVRDFKRGNLKGTCRTLDGTFGAVKLDDGVMSKSGTAVYDDSRSLIIDGDGTIRPRANKESDIYVFAYGREYRRCLQDFYKLTGETPLIPRYCLGNWWSRYHAYTQEEYIALMQRFIDEDVPLTVATVDMDWHIVRGIPAKYFTSLRSMHCGILGWTGYTWNKDLFPDYRAFLQWLHSKNLRVTLNLHPASGVRGYEEMYMPMALEMGVDYQREEEIPFDISNVDFINAYFKYLHHPYEQDGVDFWWIDWQQGTRSEIEGLDPLWALNHYHYLDINRGEMRGIILSRYAGIGSHRYPLGFSGDTHVTWKCLAFQPYFTATATNVGYTWWSHDIGGHGGGVKDDELYTRWIQLGVFSPILRMHSCCNPLMGKEPWNYADVTEGVVKEFLRLRHRLIPYIYTMNYRNHRDGIALIEPMYYEYPDDKRAYVCRNEFKFGSELIVAPITERTDADTKCASVKVYLPKGRYTDIFNGNVYSGDGKVAVMCRGVDSIPVLAREGAIIPLACSSGYNSTDNPDALELWIYRGKNSFTMYEDDGASKAYEKGVSLRTRYDVEEDYDRISFTINPAEGDDNLKKARKYILNFKDVADYARCEIRINGKSVDMAEFIFKSRSGIRIVVNELQPSDRFNVKLIGAVKRGNGKVKDMIVNIMAKYNCSNTVKTLLYTRFAKCETDADCLKKIAAFTSAEKFRHRALKEELRELLYMDFER